MPWTPDPSTTANFIADVDAAQGYLAIALRHLDTARSLTAGLPAATRWQSPAMSGFERDLGLWLQDVAVREEAIRAFGDQLAAARIRLQQTGWAG
jgi:hypothetical protein